jgi:hypothetical protein
MVRLLVQAGANVNAKTVTTHPVHAIQHAQGISKMEAEDAEILQILIGKFAVAGHTFTSLTRM